MKTKFTNQMIIFTVHPRSALLLLHLLLIAQVHFGQQQQQFTRPKGSRHPRYCTRHADCVGQEICSDRACVDARPTSKRCANDQACPTGQGCIMERCWEEDKTSYTCKTTANCPPQTICRNNLCIDAQPTFILCKADSMCENNQACRNGLCWQAASTSSGEFVCKTYNDCPKKWICLLGVCKEGEPTDKRCVSSETCKEMHECVDGICWKQMRSGRCKQHSDCSTSMVCHKDVCHDAVRTNQQCDQQINCKPTQYCKNNSCWTLIGTSSCNGHSDCGQNNLCINRNCVQAELTGKKCIGDKECGVKQACKDGQCWKIVNDPNSKFCNSHEECDQFEICMKNQCVEGEVTNKACLSKAECSNDEICKQGICVKPRGSSSTNLCKVHDDCDDSMLCMNNECLDAVITEKDCSQDSECPDGGCRDTICWKLVDFNAGKPQSSCRKHNDCSGQLICHKGTCQSGKPSDDECNSDLDCPRTHRCKLGLCWEIPDSNCELHSDCDHYSICKKSQCRLAQPYEKKCLNDDHCELGDYCKFEICWNVMSECRVHEDCDEQYLCHNGACRQAEPNGEECFNENDCKTNEMCYGELCWKVATLNICKTDADCDAYSVCQRNACILHQPVGNPCTSDSQCPKGDSCKYGICWTNAGGA